MTEEYLKTRGSVFITIRSRDLTNTSENGNNNRGRFTLFQNIEAGDNEVLGVKLTSATIPNSWHNLCEETSNNKLTFLEGASSHTITIPDGSYSIDELTAKLKTLMETANSGAITYTFSYDEITNEITITSNSATITTMKFSLDISPRRLLGFTQEDKTFSSASALTSDRAVDITDTQNSIYIRLPNLSNQKVIESSTGKFSNIIAHIPVLLSRNSFFTYEPSNPFEMELTQKQINSIEIAITYQNEAQNVDFHRADWEVNLEIDFHNKPKAKRHRIKLHRNIIEKHKQYFNRVVDRELRLNELKKLKKLASQK